MRALRRLALAALVMVTAGVLWHAAPHSTAASAPSSPRSTAEPSPVPAAEAALAVSWSAPAGPTSASSCAPGPVVVRHPDPRHAVVDILCESRVQVAGQSRVVATAWRVRLVWRGAWSPVEVAP